MKYILILFFSFTSVLIYSQKQNIFEESVYDYISKKDSLPFFVYQKEELDTLIAINRMIPSEAEMFGLKCEVRLGFKVDRYNKIQHVKNYKTDVILPRNIELMDYSKYDSLKLWFQRETLRLVKLTEGLWYSDSIRENKEIRIKLFFISEMYDNLNRDLQFSNDRILKIGNHNSLLVKKELYNYGVRKFQLKKMHLAKIYFEESIKFFPNDIDAHYNLASCYYKLKFPDKACMQWKVCLELGDTSVQEQISKYCK